MKVYFISGLAADSRVFKNIKLPEGFEAVYLDWIKPLKDESLESYAIRLAEKIDHHKKFILVGLSMGGMIASEIAKKYKPEITILVSSAPTFRQFPKRFRVARNLHLHKIIPAGFLKSASVVMRLFTTESPEDKVVLKQVIRDSDPLFIRWAIGAILNWRNEVIPQPMWHIHGTNDKILPMRYTKPTHIITNGGHLMIMSRANDLNRILESIRDI